MPKLREERKIIEYEIPNVGQTVAFLNERENVFWWEN